jgi:ribulose-phosphate 3-epimerase
MITIIPAINVPEWEEIVRRVKLIESFAKDAGIDTLHLDVTDGTYTKNSYWHRAADLLSLETSLKIEVHLMIGRPDDNPIEERIVEWLLPQKIMRAILHVETSNDMPFAITKCHEAGIQVGAAIAPGTPWTQLAPYLESVEMVHVLGVHPGLSGQEMQTEEVFDKLHHFFAHPPKGGLIEVDGGVSQKNAGALIKAGANILVAGSAIFDAEDPREAIRHLRGSTS